MGLAVLKNGPLMVARVAPPRQIFMLYTSEVYRPKLEQPDTALRRINLPCRDVRLRIVFFVHYIRRKRAGRLTGKKKTGKREKLCPPNNPVPALFSRKANTVLLVIR